MAQIAAVAQVQSLAQQFPQARGAAKNNNNNNTGIPAVAQLDQWHLSSARTKTDPQPGTGVKGPSVATDASIGHNCGLTWELHIPWDSQKKKSSTKFS